jgi:apolipoprotein N-acyltransferase
MKKIKSFFKGKFFAATLAGALCSLAFAPFHFFVAAVFSLSIFYFLLEKKITRKEVFLLGFCYGFSYFLSGVYWIANSLLVDEQFFWLIPFALTLIPAALAVYFGLFSLAYKFLVEKFNFNKIYQKALIFACCWLVFEVLRSVLFTGFPWNLLGYIWLFDIAAAQLADLFGIYGLSFFAVLICLFPILFLQKNGTKISADDKIFAAILVMFFVGNIAYGYLKIDEKKIITDPKAKLRLVQGNIEQEMKWNAQEKYQNLMKHIALSNAKSLEDVAAVIWSETSIPYAIDGDSELLDKLALATPPQGVLISGALKVAYSDIYKNEVSKVWNSVFVLNKNGVIDSYDKHHLVPFGEYIPWQKYLPFVEKITEGSLGFSEGEGPKTLLVPSSLSSFSFSPLICYEVIFSNETLNKKLRPDLLVNVTNDAWFGKSTGPYQHLDIAKMRSIEYGLPMARVANTGITAFIDPFGRIVDKINLNQSGIIEVNLIKSLAPTIYEKYGASPLFLMIIAVILFLTLSLRQKNATR